MPAQIPTVQNALMVNDETTDSVRQIGVGEAAVDGDAQKVVVIDNDPTLNGELLTLPAGSHVAQPSGIRVSSNPADAGDSTVILTGDAQETASEQAAQSQMSDYATLALAIADTANLTDGQLVIIAGGDNQSTGVTDADRGIWRVNTNQGAAFSDYQQVLDVPTTIASFFPARWL